jgi:hypothetical protein
MIFKKKLLFLMLLMVCIAFKIRAQQATSTDLPHGVHPGTVTTADGQTLQGYVVEQDYVRNQKECIFYTNYKDARTERIFHPDDLKGYSIENHQYQTIAYSGNLSFGKANKNFFYISKPGAITTYVYYAPQPQVFWQKGDEEPVSNSSMLFGFKKAAIKLVGDDAELAAKIDRKEKGYGMMNLEQIVDEYNAWANSKK